MTNGLGIRDMKANKDFLLQPSLSTRLYILGQFLAVVVVVLLALVACSGPPKPTVSVSSRPLSDNIPVPAKDFRIIIYQGEEYLDRKEVNFSELLGEGRPVVLNFWAGLCPPCRIEMPHFQEVNEEYKDRVLVFGLDVGPFIGLGSSEDGQALLKQLKVTFPAGTTLDASVVKTYGLVGMPTTIFFKPNGEATRKWTGLLTKGQLAEMVEELLTASANP